MTKQTKVTKIDMSQGAVCARITEAVDKKIVFLPEAIQQAYNAGYAARDREATKC
jgi:hypothetical protein